MKGDKNALFDIAPYFDSVTKFIVHGTCTPETISESNLAKRIITENCLFTETEITISDTTSSSDFTAFINRNAEKIIFSSFIDAFLITPIENRTASAVFREMPENRRLELQATRQKILETEWVKELKIDSLIASKNPRVLLSLAVELFKSRNRYSAYVPYKEGNFSLLQILLNAEVGVENDERKPAWHIVYEPHKDAALNLLIWLTRNYSNFKWDEKRACFTNDAIQIATSGKEEYLMQILRSSNDSLALDAFIQLTIGEPQKVIPALEDFGKAGYEFNDEVLPIFTYRFLQQLVQFTAWCRNNHIDFTGSLQWRAVFHKLELELPFPERRRLEDSIINNASVEEINALEYWALIKEQSWELVYSTGRILDVFYSKNWGRIMDNNKYLELYLKKSYLFDQLGIIGVCNFYLKKFTGLGSPAMVKLNMIQTGDTNIQEQIAKAKGFCVQLVKKPSDTNKINIANWDYDLTNMVKKIRAIAKMRDSSAMGDSLVALLSRINYNQIGLALQEVDRITKGHDRWGVYEFLERDFRFFMMHDFGNIATRKAFLKLYNSLSEYELYAYLLDRAGIGYRKENGSFDYDKIYEILKYNVVNAFAGGGGGDEDNEVYTVIKLLELTHKTTLGYPQKICNAGLVYGCDARDRANEWMQYLQDNKLLKERHDEPVSFNYKK